MEHNLAAASIRPDFEEVQHQFEQCNGARIGSAAHPYLPHLCNFVNKSYISKRLA